ncbi:MAG: hypothetical protein EBU96_09960 [Actinobacteria bacterium]|nr:hypothetical protein [Actinomycetota bacterium]
MSKHIMDMTIDELAQLVCFGYEGIMDMTIDELAQLVCFGYEGHPCTNTLDEYGCRNSMKDNEPFCSECCADTTNGACCG